MRPGFLPPAGQVKELTHINASQFYSLDQCPLRGLMNASCSNDRLLPNHPATYIGTVIHEFISFAENSNKILTKEELDDQWKSLLKLKEEELQSNWLHKSALPLMDQDPNSEIKRIQAFKRARLLNQQQLGKQGSRQNAPRGAGRGTRSVQTRDGLIRGIFDSVQRTDAGTTITDYKSGRITSEELTRYETQLKLYALLDYESHGQWPTKLLLDNFSSSPHGISIQPEECKELGSKAKDLLAFINDAVLTNQLTGLAKPSPKTCQYCQHRPACKAYRDGARNRPGNDWPKDLWGIVDHIKRLLNGRLLITLTTDYESSPTKQVNINHDTDHYPALLDLSIGHSISLFNLKQRPTPNDYDALPYTIIYREDYDG